MDDETLKVYGYVISSSYSAKSVKSLNESDKIPTVLAEDICIRKNHISKVLRELKECGVAECIDEEKRKNRVYRLTEKGKDIAELIYRFSIPEYLFLKVRNIIEKMDTNFNSNYNTFTNFNSCFQ